MGACLAVIGKSKLIQTFNIFALLLARSMFVKAGQKLAIKSFENDHLFKKFCLDRDTKTLELVPN